MIYELKVQLQGIEPPIWRNIKVPSKTHLSKLHRILQLVMGWTDSHLHLFQVGDKLYGEPSTDWDFEVLDSQSITLEKVFEAGIRSFVYEYDLGDSWRHDITLVGAAQAEGKEETVCIAGARACPPEDCGGIPGYCDLLEKISDPQHEGYEDMVEWLGRKYDPEEFDLAEVNRALRSLR